jgi:hypothetical protein
MSDDKIKRRPITASDIGVPIPGDPNYTSHKGGIARPAVTSGQADPVKGAQARKVNKSLTAGGGVKTAGMMIDNVPNMNTSYSTRYLDAYRTSYASGGDDRGGTYDVPTYFVEMNDKNGGVIYWPTTLREKYSWYRYFYRTDAYVGRALDLLTDLPMSKLTLNMPKAKGMTKKQKEEINNFYDHMMERLGLFDVLRSSLFEVNCIGNSFLFHEWDDKMKMWSSIQMLPPEEVSVFQFPFSDKKRIEYRPERLIGLIKQHDSDNGEEGGFNYSDSSSDSSLSSDIVDLIPEDIKNMINESGAIMMDSDPMSGSFTYHMTRKRAPYLELGASLLERILVPLLQKENYRYTQLSLANRNMTPKNLIVAPNLTGEELEDLRLQVDLSYLDPDYSIITNYEVDWSQIGADQRLLDLSKEYETIDNQIFSALGVTRELLTGEGAFGGNKITVEILNTMFLHSRQMLIDYVEQQLFKPVAEANGWYSTDSNGIKNYWYPRVGFNRLTIRDNSEVFDSLFQLYQKGSLPVDVIYELFNLDADSLSEKLEEQLFTVKDATFNRLLEEANLEVGRNLIDRSNIVEKVTKYLNLDYKEPDEGGDVEGGEDGFGGGFEDEAEGPQALPDDIVDGVADISIDEGNLGPDSTDQEIEEAVQEGINKTS